MANLFAPSLTRFPATRAENLSKQSHFVAEELITLLGDEKSKVENGLLADRLVEARADQLMVGR